VNLGMAERLRLPATGEKGEQCLAWTKGSMGVRDGFLVEIGEERRDMGGGGVARHAFEEGKGAWTQQMRWLAPSACGLVVCASWQRRGSTAQKQGQQCATEETRRRLIGGPRED
jgi:hypothetical protein